MAGRYFKSRQRFFSTALSLALAIIYSLAIAPSVYAEGEADAALKVQSEIPGGELMDFEGEAGGLSFPVNGVMWESDTQMMVHNIAGPFNESERDTIKADFVEFAETLGENVSIGSTNSFQGYKVTEYVEVTNGQESMIGWLIEYENHILYNAVAVPPGTAPTENLRSKIENLSSVSLRAMAEQGYVPSEKSGEEGDLDLEGIASGESEAEEAPKQDAQSGIVPGTTTTGSKYEPNSSGDVFEGGVWNSSQGESDYLERRFDSPTLISEIRIVRAGTDVTTDNSSLTMKIQTPDGNWTTVDSLQNTNINITSLTGGEEANSIPSYSKVLDEPVEAIAFRLEMTGHGWFSAESIELLSESAGSVVPAPGGIGSVGNIPGPESTTEAVAGVVIPGVLVTVLGNIIGMAGTGGFSPSGASEIFVDGIEEELSPVADENIYYREDNSEEVFLGEMREKSLDGERAGPEEELENEIYEENEVDSEGYDREGYDKNGYDREGYDEYGYDEFGYDRDGFDQEGYSQNGYDRDGYDRNGLDSDGYDRYGYDSNGYDKSGYDRGGYNSEGYDSEGYNVDGYDSEGYDKEGYSIAKYDRDGYDKSGYDIYGYDSNGYDREGYDVEGYSSEGYSQEGYDREGYDSEGYDSAGYNKSGYDRDGYSQEGYDQNGYDREGYNADGYNTDGYNRDGYDSEGYDQEGYNADGYDRDGARKDGYDSEGYDSEGYNSDGYDRDGYDRDGYNKEGYDREGYSRSGYDKFGVHKDYKKKPPKKTEQTVQEEKGPEEEGPKPESGPPSEPGGPLPGRWEYRNVGIKVKIGPIGPENPQGTLEAHPVGLESTNPFKESYEWVWVPGEKPKSGETPEMPEPEVPESEIPEPEMPETETPEPEAPELKAPESDSGIIGPEDPMNTLKNHDLGEKESEVTGQADTLPESEETSLPEEPESMVITTSVHGAQKLIVKDPETGQWTDPETGSVIDLEKHQENLEQQVKDYQDYINRNDELEKTGQTAMQQALEKIQKDAKEEIDAIQKEIDKRKMEQLKWEQDNLEWEREQAEKGNSWGRIIANTMANAGGDIVQAGKDIKDGVGYVVDKTVEFGEEAVAIGEDIWNDPSIMTTTLQGTIQDIQKGVDDAEKAVNETIDYIASNPGEAWKNTSEASIKAGKTVLTVGKGIVKGVYETVTDPKKAWDYVKNEVGIENFENSLDPNRSLVSRIGQVFIGTGKVGLTILSAGEYGAIKKGVSKLAGITDDLAEAGAKKLATKTAKKTTKEATESLATGKVSKKAESLVEKAQRQARYKAESAKMNVKANKASERADNIIEDFKKHKKENMQKVDEIRDEAFWKGREVGGQKVDELKKAQRKLMENPDSEEAAKAYEKAMEAVQKDKHAMHKLNDLDSKRQRGDKLDEARSKFSQNPKSKEAEKAYKDSLKDVRKDQLSPDDLEDGDEVRKMFNTKMKQKAEVADKRARDRVAKEYGVADNEVKTVGATNTMDTSGAPDPRGYAQKPKNVSGQPSVDGVDDFKAADVDVSKVKGDKVSYDIDKTYRVKVGERVDPVTGKVTPIYKDVKAEDTKRIFGEEYYKEFHDGKLPTKLDANGKEVVDYDAVNKFSKDMDVSAVDHRSAEAYGAGDRDLKEMIKKDGSVKDLDDLEASTKTMEYKAHEWENQADEIRKEFGDLSKAESWSEESMRQTTKQFNNQICEQVKAKNLENLAKGKEALEIPEDLFTAVKIMEKVGDGGISPVEAEKILKGMGLSPKKVSEQMTSIFESIQKAKK